MQEMNLKNKKILIIVESPNKVKTITEIVKKAGYNAKVMASVGHIMELVNGGSYYNTGIEPNDNFKMDIRIDAEKKDVVTKLKAQAEWADMVYLMTDGDREGEVISWSLIKFLKLPKTKYKRAITHEITPKAVISALENSMSLNDNLVEAGLSRLALDKIIGYRLSSIARNEINAKSVGRCQSCGLKIIADREREIQNFIPETYFDLYINFKKNKTEFKAKFVGSNLLGNIEHLKTQKEVDAVKALCTDDYIIQGIDKKEKQESPKPPFCTSTFQQEVASKLGLSVKDAMSVAQKLFEGIEIGGKHTALITYMRTDDTEFAPEFIPELKTYIVNTYGKDRYIEPRKAKKQDGAQEGHECLRCIDPNMTPEILAKHITNELQLKVYKIIWQRTIAACLPNAVYSETGYLIDNNGQKFLLTSKELREEGFKTVYSYKDEDEEEAGVVRETFVKGEVLQNTKLKDEKKQTKPPVRFTEATLVKKLQTTGVGRPSTYATIVETVLSESRGYATKDGKSIVPTDKGMKLAEFLDNAFSNIIKLDYTKEMEEDLDKIASGKLTKIKFLEGFYNTLESTIKDNPALKAAKASGKVCPKCGKPLVVRKGKYGPFLGCSGYPDCKHLEKL